MMVSKLVSFVSFVIFVPFVVPYFRATGLRPK